MLHPTRPCSTTCLLLCAPEMEPQARWGPEYRAVHPQAPHLCRRKGGWAGKKAAQSPDIWGLIPSQWPREGQRAGEAAGKVCQRSRETGKGGEGEACDVMGGMEGLSGEGGERSHARRALRQEADEGGLWLAAHCTHAGSSPIPRAGLPLPISLHHHHPFPITLAGAHPNGKQKLL